MYKYLFKTSQFTTGIVCEDGFRDHAAAELQ